MTFRERMENLRERVKTPCFWVTISFIAIIIFSPIWATEWINLLGPSTSYFDQRLRNAVPGPDGKPMMFVGDEFSLNARTIRHSTNGQCILQVWRVRQLVNGPHDSEIHLIQHAPGQPGEPIEQGPFEGHGVYRNTEWPIAPAKIPITDDWIPNGQDTQVTDVFVIGRYFCNFMDYIIPRWLKDADGINADHDPTPERPRPLIGFKIKCWYSDVCWNEDKHYESGHVRFTVARRKPA